MAYSKQNFQNGQTLDATNLETMENGIIAGQGVKNLLINSNFKDPINSGGRTSWSASGITIDKWRMYPAITVNLTSSGITVDATNVAGNFQQDINDLPNGTYTFAALVNGAIRTIVFTNNNGTITVIDNSNASFGDSGSINAGKGISAYYVQINNAQGHTNTIVWAALYEGNYTVNTLPNYVPKDKYIEMLNCGVSLVPHNLLNNSDFRDPVNSQGKTKYTGDTNAIDKWKLSGGSASTLTLMNHYARLATGQESTAVLTQSVSGLRDGVYTQAINLAGTIYTRIIKLSGSTITTIDDSNATYDSGHIDCSVDSSGNYSFNLRTSNGIDILWAALYEGAYTADSLPTYVPKGKHVEMLNCGVSLTPPNLLINSDFSNPVAQAGLNRTYNQTKYLCDRWVGYQNMEAEQQPNGIKLTTTVPYSRILQYVNLQVGKAYTLAFCASNISSQHRIAVCNEDLSKTVQIKAGSDEILVINFIAEYNTMAMLYYPGYSNNGGSSLLKWAALYEGTYITETLPSYIPKGIYAEMFDCGIPLAPHNFLNNSDFCNPINQSGMTGYGGQRQTIDKWHISGGTAHLTTSGIQLVEGATFFQTVPLSLGTYTFAVYLSDKTTLSIQFTYNGQSAITILDGTSETTGANIIVSNYMPGIVIVKFIQTDNSATHTLVWAALYKGAYNVSTLPPYVPKGKHIEMLNCGIPFPPYNLLDNSDFTNAVNSHEVEEVTDSSTYFIDRWTTNFANGTQKVNVDKSGMTLNNTYGGVELSVQQEVGNLKDGAYTAAASANGTISLCQFLIIGGDYSENSKINLGAGQIHINCTDARLTFSLRAPANQTVTFKWAALYEGIYDVDALPIYQPKGKHVEMLNCGVPLTPYNLLDNSDFTNPVNQRGATTATLGKYFIDRWNTEAFSSGPSITIDSNGLTLLPTTGSTAGIFQEIPDYEKRKGKIHTFAICVGNEWKCVSFIMGNFGVGYQIHGLYFFSVDGQHILIRNKDSDNPAPITIQRVALYEGSYDASTLPAYQPKGYAAELAECQRYYRPMLYPVIPCGNNPAGNQVYGFLPIKMRIASPTISCDTLYFFKGDSSFVPVSSASASTYKAGTRIVFSLSSNVEGNLAGTIAGNGITLSADL